MEKLPRILVVDACILFSFFRSDSSRRRILEELSDLGCRLITPEFAFDELMPDKEKVMRYGKINDLGFMFLFSLLERKIESFSEETYEEFLPEANEISPHGKQTKDDAYFALAMTFNSAIWSDEGAFKKQSKVKVLSTSELLKLLRLG